MKCPDCGCECDRYSVDNGVGIIYGPYGCPECGWSEHEQYNQKLNPNKGYDQWGWLYPRSVIKEVKNE